MQIKFWVIGLVAFCALLAATGQLFFKIGSATVTKNIMSWITNWRFITGVILYAISAVLFVWALRYGNLNVLYPIIATSYVWVALFAGLFLGEPFGLVKWFGIVFILVGIVLIIR